MTSGVFDPPLHFYLFSYSQTGFANFPCQTGAQSEVFRNRGGFMELGQFDKHFDPAGKNFSIIFP